MKNCKQCGWLTKSIFKRDNLDVFICNNLKSNSTMEKTVDFNICIEFDYKKHFFKK